MEQTLNELKYAIEHCQMARKENNEALAGKWADIAHSYLDTALNNKVDEVTVTIPLTKEEDADLFVKPYRGVFYIKFKEHFNLGNTPVKDLSPDMLRKYHNEYQYYVRWRKCSWEK